VAIVVWRTPETVTPERPGQRFRWRDYVELVTDPNMARIILADLALSFGPASMAALYIFFFRDFLRFTPGQANLLLLFYIVSGVVGAPTLAWLATKISKHRTVMLACAIYSLLIISFAFLPKGNVMGALPTMFMTGFLAAGFNVLTRAMTADVADEMRLRQGKERSGLLYALTTLTTKFAQGGSIFLIFSVLDWRGFDAKLGQANTPEAMQALVLCGVIVPVVFVMLGGACLLGYKLTAERAAEVRRQLEERDALHEEASSIESITAGPGEIAPLRP
jgi:Na+/melibiose symporter-like transporter